MTLRHLETSRALTSYHVDDNIVIDVFHWHIAEPIVAWSCGVLAFGLPWESHKSSPPTSVIQGLLVSYNILILGLFVSVRLMCFCCRRRCYWAWS
jgi:hypothetical protein